MRLYLTHELSALNLDCELARTEFLGPSDPVAFNGCETDSSRFHGFDRDGNVTIAGDEDDRGWKIATQQRRSGV